ncbi:tRNA lysidine(34) synthetase TilS [Mogibacterium neglectum]|uniref:tRNA lysidine(34) synthetase TilS n=1 Tax=Mogibacterium neglectum TaxID=114528 RepID=UPI00272A17C3|nr:tRNA lysidine(34) synthetase TilS [Mogibacterium neglectum]WLD76706.1 tRNA lysidine(34) synthetase TilS [Mogibacterium neglectum]
MKGIIKKIIDSKTIKHGDTIIVGFSGGPDSLTLLHALDSVKEVLGLSIYAAHINHQIRPVDCDKEAEHARDICEELGIPFKLVICDCKVLAKLEKVSEEEAGRKIRYKAFSDMANEIEQCGTSRDKIKIAIAQNSDDQVETVLFHILRGTAVRGLTGIPISRLDECGYMVIRPLLGISRTEIEEYVDDYDLKPNIDKSNEKPIYSRNKIRLELIPELEREYNPSLRKAVLRLSKSAACDDEYMMNEAMKLYDESISENHEYGIYKIRAAHGALKRRIATIMLEAEGVHPTYELVNSIVGIINSDNPSASYNLPGGKVAERRYDNLVFSQEKHGDDSYTESESWDITDISISSISIAEYLGIRGGLNGSKEKRALYAAFDLDKLIRERGLETEIVCATNVRSQLGINLRTRKSGDYIRTGNGSKKLQDFLVDEKVPKSSRDEIKLAVIGSEILWILPDEMFRSERYKIKGKYSQKYQIDDSSERVLFLELR